MALLAENDVIEEVRRDREDLARVLKKHTGIRKIVEELYPDSAHFIYELLQNAEDTGATEATFILSDSSLIFEHNGRPFEKADIEGITDIGEGAKGEDDDKIGRFGVGFKAVFAYSETPHIWSPTFSFKIEDLVLPTAIRPMPALGTKTRFEFPFNNPEKTPEKAFAEVEAGLSQLAETTLLFLSHLERIGWEVGAGASGQIMRIQHSEHHIEVFKESAGRTTASSHFLSFEEPVPGLEKQRVAVAFALDFLPGVHAFDPDVPLAKQFRIVETPGLVAVYFPAEKETSGLRFHLHAPFVPELSRASIKETPANQPLFEQLAKITAASLDDIRDLGLLTRDFLAVLPNPQDELDLQYLRIRTAILQAMNTRALTPTHRGSHAPASQLIQARATLKELLSEEDLEYLVEYEHEPPKWAVAATQNNSNVDRFLDALEITDWGIDEFVELLSGKASEGTRYITELPYWVDGPDEEFMAWLSRKPVEWHQHLYALLYKELESEGDLDRLSDVRIVRLSDGAHGTGCKSFFPSEGAEHDRLLPRVDAAVYMSGKSKTQQHNARKFLEDLGVREVGEAEQIEAILEQGYTKEADIPDDKTNLRDLRRFVSLVEKQPGHAGMFADYYIFELEDGDWGQPREAFLDRPFMDTGLRAYYGLREDPGLAALSQRYLECGIAIERIAKFASAVGARMRLEVGPTACRGNPQWSYLRAVGGERNTSPIDRDYKIEDLEEVLENPSLELSKLIWATMCRLPGDGRYLTATYRRNMSAGARQCPSQLVHVLRDAAWVPQKNGNFVRPAEADLTQLPEGFPYETGQPWLEAVRFGEEVAKRSEEHRQKQAVAKELGFADDDSLERAKRFAALPSDEQERILADWEGRARPELPEDEPANPARRAERVGEQAADAPERRTEERPRSIPLDQAPVKEKAAQYLRHQYTVDGAMVCQVCKGRLPFKLDDGTDYFETVEFLPELKRRHYQNYLALCPNHSAMFRYANGSRKTVHDSFMEMTGNELEIVLARKNKTIYFTKTHIADLKSVIDADNAANSEDVIAGAAE